VQNALGNVKAAGGLSHTNMHANTRGYCNTDGHTALGDPDNKTKLKTKLHLRASQAKKELEGGPSPKPTGRDIESNIKGRATR